MDNKINVISISSIHVIQLKRPRRNGLVIYCKKKISKIESLMEYEILGFSGFV